jgi:ATP-binding cassette subfamily B protein
VSADLLMEAEEEDFATRLSGKTIRRIVGLLRNYWLSVVVFVSIVGLVSFMDSVFTYLSMLIVDEGIVAQDSARLYEILTLYGSMIVVQAVLVFGFIYICGILGEQVRYDLRKGLFNHLQDLSLPYYNRMPVGWIISRVTSDTDRVAELVTWGLLDVTWSTMNIATAVYFMMRINWQLGLIVLTIIPVIIVIATLFQKRIISEYREVRKINSKITGRYNETITGVRVIKSLNRESENLRSFGGVTGEMYKASYRAAWLSALFLPTVQLIGSLAIASIVVYSGLTVGTGAMTLGGIQAFVSYVLFMVWPIQEMARVFAEMQQAVASAERIFSLQDAVPDVVDKPGSLDPGTLVGEIVFDNVSFAYENGKPVLSDFNLRVEPGEMIALVGPTGGGKSTIVNLLCRFFEPKQGVIAINGIDYTTMTQHAIQSRIGMVLQTPHLFSGTIRENIRYGRLTATDAETENAAQIAGAHEFIMQLGKGYDEQVGEGGVLLSTGQKQLISLARAVLAQPDIFIMDEATSSVDTMTEALIQKGMEALMTRCTSFVIAHRLSTIRNADRILVIENGRIAEMGTHSELLRQNGHYYRLYTRQFREEMEQVLDPWVADDSQWQDLAAELNIDEKLGLVLQPGD